MRTTQLEDLVASTLRTVDKLATDMQEFREYLNQNTKVVNELIILQV